MKRLGTPYWILTGLLAAFMLMASVPDVSRFPPAVAIIMHLGYPAYLLPFIGTAELLGILAILVPAYPRIEAWAYAGLCFDLIGALYSHLSMRNAPGNWLPAALALLLTSASYALYRRAVRSSAEATSW